jgi:hypothetical protein
VVAARVESEERQKQMREEIDELRGYLVSSQETVAELTGDTSRPPLIARATRMLNKLKPWVGINIQKSIFEQCSQSGVTIVTMKQGGPAFDAGLKQGMIVERINDIETRFNAEFSRVDEFFVFRSAFIMFISTRMTRTRCFCLCAPATGQRSRRVLTGTRTCIHMDCDGATPRAAS